MNPMMEDEENMVPASQLPNMRNSLVNDVPTGGEDGGEDDMATMMDELDQAGEAGEQYAGDSFFAEVPGAEGAEEGEGMQSGESAVPAEMTREVLEQLLAKLPPQ